MKQRGAHGRPPRCPDLGVLNSCQAAARPLQELDGGVECFGCPRESLEIFFLLRLQADFERETVGFSIAIVDSAATPVFQGGRLILRHYVPPPAQGIAHATRLDLAILPSPGFLGITTGLQRYYISITGGFLGR